ncbi:MAG: pathogenicity-like protein [Lysobacteraceae bacterium]|nr:MAG: pathogenicity-like protein [Xanthomonadaceae bacterium]
MRQVFTSLRIETVEGVVKLLEDAGIEVHLANGRSYHSKRSGQFSYAEPMKLKQQPSVWVKRAEDQPRAREILREAGLLATTRPTQGEPLVFAGADTIEEKPKRPLAWRIRVALLIAIAIAALVTVLRSPKAPSPAPAAPTPVQAPAADPVPEEEDSIRIRIPAPEPGKP